jgi:hypothetical protein
MLAFTRHSNSPQSIFKFFKKTHQTSSNARQTSQDSRNETTHSSQQSLTTLPAHTDRVRNPSKHDVGKQVKPGIAEFVHDSPEGRAAEQFPIVSAFGSSSDASQFTTENVCECRGRKVVIKGKNIKKQNGSGKKQNGSGMQGPITETHSHFDR